MLSPKWFDGENKVLNHEQACDYRREVTKRMANAGWIENEDYTCEIVEMDDDFDFDNQPVFDNQPEFN